MNSEQDDWPLPFDFSDADLDEMISVQFQNVQNAKTPEDKQKADALLVMFRERAKWRFVRELPPLFRLYQHEDGRWRAKLSSVLHAKANSLRAKTHTDKETEVIAEAVNCLAAAGHLFAGAPLGTLAGDECAKVLLQTLDEGLIPRLHAMMSATPEARRRLGEKLKKDLAHAIDQHVKPEGIKPRANATLVHTNAPVGQSSDILIEQAAIEGARLLAEQNQELPTKQSLRNWIEQHYPETLSLSSGKWSSVWESAGLEALPRSPRW